MPVYDIDSHRPTGSFEPDRGEGWSVPIGQIAGIRFFLSYSVFVSLAVLAALVAMVHNRGGNEDLPVLAVTAVAIWATGWAVQSAVQLCLHFGMGIQTDSITIGVFGIELPNPLRRSHLWTAAATLTSSMTTIIALLMFGIGCMGIHLILQGENLLHWTVWRDALASPQFSIGELKNIYLTATWLFWIQAACQLFPMPPNLGRGALAATIAIFAAEANELLQTKLLRKSIQLIAIVTLFIAMVTMITDGDQYLPKWPVLVLLSIYLWVSNNHRDLTDWIASINLADADPTHEPFSEESKQAWTAQQRTVPPKRWTIQLADSIRLRRKRKLAREVLRREHEEANDAARLDQVLQTVAERGTDGISDDDKALLRRVSENLRRQREADEARPESEPKSDTDPTLDS